MQLARQSFAVYLMVGTVIGFRMVEGLGEHRNRLLHALVSAREQALHPKPCGFGIFRTCFDTQRHLIKHSLLARAAPLNAGSVRQHGLLGGSWGLSK